MKQNYCNRCRTNEQHLPISLRPCHSCRDAFYCSDRCRNTDQNSHACKHTLSDENGYTRNCYLIQGKPLVPSTELSFNVSTLTEQMRGLLLHQALRRSEELSVSAQAILKQIDRWNLDIAGCFELKQSPFSTAPLRMVHSRWEHISNRHEQPSHSYVALSYSWRTDGWTVVADAYRPSSASQGLPICEVLWKFLVAQLEEDEEGVWADQLCLDQDDRLEKVSAIASMDSLYANARFVYIALEDVWLTVEGSRY